jgi:pSer/pThr/pTyr-binding forkhead associated (FHA) protein
MPRLHIISPSEIAGTIDLTENLITFGRAAGNAICINDSNVSSCHGILVRDGEGYQLHDFNSTNGTFVNGERILAVKLQHEASIRLGPVELRYESTPARTAVAPLGAKQADAGLKPAASKEPGMSKRVKPEFAGSQLASGPVVLQPGFSNKPIPQTSDKN